jgi:hypothetical protein
MLRDTGDNAGHARQAAGNVLAARNLFDETYDGVLSGWLLRHGLICLKNLLAQFGYTKEVIVAGEIPWEPRYP